MNEADLLTFLFHLVPPRFDVEALSLTLRQRTSSLTQFLVRLAGILGGVWVCAGYTLRVGNRAAQTAMKVYQGGDEDDTNGYPSGYSAAYSSSRNHTAGQAGADPYNTPTRRPGAMASYTDASSIGSPGSPGLFSTARDRAGQAWQTGMQSIGGQKHRKTESLATKIMSEEGRGTL